MRFFRACATDVTASVVERVRKLMSALNYPSAEVATSKSSTQHLHSEWEKRPRLELATRFYYHILERMLLAEERRLNQSNFTVLLNHDQFHTSVLACCVELVLFSYKMIDMAFPYVLVQFGIKPFDFCKVIESVVRHEPDVSDACVFLTFNKI